MVQRFKPGKPSDQEILDYAAGLGLEFAPGSSEETYFLIVCSAMWAHGYGDGIDGFMRNYDKITKAQSASERVTESV